MLEDKLYGANLDPPTLSFGEHINITVLASKASQILLSARFIEDNFDRKTSLTNSWRGPKIGNVFPIPIPLLVIQKLFVLSLTIRRLFYVRDW